MIFITLGSQKFQFNRLLRAVDEQLKNGRIKEQVFAQRGYSDYIPQKYEYKDFLDRNEFSEVMKKADIVITHGGTGAIIGALKNEKKVIAVPRYAKYEEHVDDHQLQIVKQFKNMDLIYGCLDVEELEEALIEVRDKNYKKYESNTQKIIENINMFVEGL